MANVYTPIDLSTLPPPSVVQALDYETILGQMLTDLQARDPAFTALVESDPAFKILEVCAYREMLIRQRVNDAAREVMLAYSTGANLEQLAGLFGVVRKTITPGNPDTIPPTPAVMEDDESLRFRTQLALEGLSTAGPVGAYQYHALKVTGVKDVAVAGPPVTDPGDVRITVLSSTGDGAASPALVAAVAAALNDENVRPLTDNVTVQAATIVPFAINATLNVFPGPDATLVAQKALAAVQSFVASVHRVGRDVRISALHAALHQAGVESVVLSAPGIVADLTITDEEAAWCTDIDIATAIATP